MSDYDFEGSRDGESSDEDSALSEIARLGAEGEQIEANLKMVERELTTLVKHHELALSKLNKAKGYLGLFKNSSYSDLREKEQEAKEALDTMLEDKSALEASLRELQEKVELYTGQTVGQVEANRTSPHTHSQSYLRSNFEKIQLESVLEFAKLKSQLTNPKSTLAEVRGDLEAQTDIVRSCQDDIKTIEHEIAKVKRLLTLEEGTETANIKLRMDELESDIKRYSNRGFFGRFLDGVRRFLGLRTAKESAQDNYDKFEKLLLDKLKIAKSEFNEFNTLMRKIKLEKEEAQTASAELGSQVDILQKIQMIQANLDDSLDEKISDWLQRCELYKGTRVGVLKESRAATRILEKLAEFIEEPTRSHLNDLTKAFESKDNQAAKTDVRLMKLLQEVGEEYEEVNRFLPRPDFIPIDPGKALECSLQEKRVHNERLAELVNKREELEASILARTKAIEILPEAMKENQDALATLLWAQAQFQMPLLDANDGARRAQEEADDVCNIKIEALKRHMTPDAISKVTQREEGYDKTDTNSPFYLFLVMKYDENLDAYKVFRHNLCECTTNAAILDEPFSMSKLYLLKAELGDDAFKAKFYDKVWPSVAALMLRYTELVSGTQVEFESENKQPFLKKVDAASEALDDIATLISNHWPNMIDVYEEVIKVHNDGMKSADEKLGGVSYDEASSELRQASREEVRDTFVVTLQALQSMHLDLDLATFESAVNYLSSSAVLDSYIAYQDISTDTNLTKEKHKLASISRKIHQEEQSLARLERAQSGSGYLPTALAELAEACVGQGSKAAVDSHKTVRVGLKNFLSYPTQVNLHELKEKMKKDPKYVKDENLVQLFERAGDYFSEVRDLHAKMTPSRSSTPTTVEDYDTSSMSSLSSDSDDEADHDLRDPPRFS